MAGLKRRDYVSPIGQLCIFESYTWFLCLAFYSEGREQPE